MLFADEDSCIVVSLLSIMMYMKRRTASDDGYTDVRHDDESWVLSLGTGSVFLVDIEVSMSGFSRGDVNYGG